MTVTEYVQALPEERRVVIEKLQKLFKKNLPKGFEEQMSYGMVGYVVPHKIYSDGYHCDPKLPLPFLSIASQIQQFQFLNLLLFCKYKTEDHVT